MSREKSYRIEINDRVLWVTALGVTTLRDTEEYVEEFRRTVQPLLGAPWACVLDMRGWLPSPSETFALYRDNSLWCFARQLSYVVVILPLEPVQAWQYIKATDVPRPDTVITERAADENQARSVLRALGYLD